MNGTVKQLLSAVGGVVCVDGREDEIIITAIADGSCYPGWAVTILATNVIIAVDTNGDDRFTGILLPTYKQDCDAQITSGTMCEVVIPQKGHTYNVSTTNLAADFDIGAAVEFGTIANDGRFCVSETTIEVMDYMASLNKWYDDTDLIAEITWRQ